MTDPDLIIEPRRGKKEKLLPKRALLVVNPAEAEFAAKAFEPFVGEVRSFYQTQLLVDSDKMLCLAGPALGAPAAVLIVEKLIVLGVTEILLISCCGALDPCFSIGDVIVATGGVSGEGVSRYYATTDFAVPCAEATAELFRFGRQSSIEVRKGITWSTDAPYRERRSELIGLQEQYGINSVDMEFSALCNVASFRGVSFGAIFVVSDMLWTRHWKLGFGGAEFNQRSHDLISKLIRYELPIE